MAAQTEFVDNILSNKYMIFISREDARLIKKMLQIGDDERECFDRTYSDCLERFQEQIKNNEEATKSN